MPINLQLVQTPEEYIDLVGKFAALVEAEMKKAESQEEPGRAHAIADRLPLIISLVNSIGALRGEGDAISDVRPKPMGGEKQGELYKLEEAFEARLVALIKEVSESSERDFYRAKLEEYYVSSRTL